MLFSSNEVADYINATFEPVWESVRPVPIVTIDFGNGHTIKRTLHGNIATYVCGSTGIVYDVLPGIYVPTVYRRQLELCKSLADSAGTLSGGELTTHLRDYHTKQAGLLGEVAQPPQMQAIARTGGGFKGGTGGGLTVGNGFLGFAGGGGGIEGPTERVLMGLPPLPGFTNAPQGPLAARPELALDAEVNERIRRPLVHQLLSMGVFRPDEIKGWLFKNVLHVDLDDSLLGLGHMLNANYPFADGNRQGEAGETVKSQPEE